MRWWALFGIPTAHEDDPMRAVRAALELHGTVRRVSEEVEQRIGAPLAMHTGINTGLVVTTPAEDERGGRVGITGDTVNTAARLVSLAQADQVVIGPDTQRRVAGFFDLESLEPVTLKGKAKPLTPWRVKGQSTVQSRFEVAAMAGLTPYTGREAELSALKDCLDKAMAGQGQLVTLSGEAGLGKSRLVHDSPWLG